MTTNNANISITAEVRSAVEQLNQLKTSVKGISDTLAINQKELAENQSS